MSPNISRETVEMPTFHQLIHVAFDAVFGHVVATASNELVDVHLHQLEHQSQSSCGPVAVYFTISHVSTTSYNGNCYISEFPQLSSFVTGRDIKLHLR
jgi:hypothetical protein